MRWQVWASTPVLLNCLGLNCDGLGDQLLSLTFCRFLADRKEQPRQLARFGLGYFAIDPRLLQRFYEKTWFG
jgi:hypothetical protein